MVSTYREPLRLTFPADCLTNRNRAYRESLEIDGHISLPWPIYSLINTRCVDLDHAMTSEKNNYASATRTRQHVVRLISRTCTIDDGCVRYFRKRPSRRSSMQRNDSCGLTVTKIHRMFQRVEFAAFALHQSVLDLDVFALLQPIG